MKKKIIILITALAILLAVCVLGYLYCDAAEVKVSFYKNRNNTERINCLGQYPQQIELGRDPKPGYTTHFQDYSLTLCGYDNVEKSSGDDYIAVFYDNKNVWFSEYKSDKIYKNPKLLSQIEKASEKEISNEYSFWDAVIYCIPNDFSMFDVNKNKSVSRLLEEKYWFYNCYQFDNGAVKGFICAMTSEEDSLNVFFSNCKVSDSFYQIGFNNFSMEEVKDMLGTITFDGSNTKQ